MITGAKRRSADDGDSAKLSPADNELARAANRLHCKETRDRRRERERQLCEEIEVLKLCQSIVEDGPDLFSLHKPTVDAPFSFLSHNFFTRLQLNPEHVLGKPLSSIVDEGDLLSLRNAICQVLRMSEAHQQCVDPTGGIVGNGGSGGVIYLHIKHGPIFCEAGMSIRRGSEGLIIVTRLYNC